MRTAADGLTAGEGEEFISQAGLRDFLWYEVPREHPAESWRPVREAAGVLLALLGQAEDLAPSQEIRVRRLDARRGSCRTERREPPRGRALPRVEDLRRGGAGSRSSRCLADSAHDRLRPAGASYL